MSLTSLDLYWSPQREDNFSTATSAGAQSAVTANYAFVRREAYLFPSSAPGVIPLKSYYHPGRGDNFTGATQEAERSAIEAGYFFVRTEGYVHTTAGNGRVPLKQYWHAGRGDNFLTGTADGESAAIAAGYSFVRIEGYGAFRPPVVSARVRTAVGRIIPEDGVMETSVSVTSDGSIEIITETINYAVFWGYHGGVTVFFSDANDMVVQGVSFSRTFGVDGTAFGRSRIIVPWNETIDPATAERIQNIHIYHYAPDDFQASFSKFLGIVNEAVTAAGPVVDLAGKIKALGAKGE